MVVTFWILIRVENHQRFSCNYMGSIAFHHRPMIGQSSTCTRNWQPMMSAPGLRMAEVSVPLPRCSTANLLLVNLDISRHKGHIWIHKMFCIAKACISLPYKRPKTLRSRLHLRSLRNGFELGLWLVTNRSKWIQHDSTKSTKKC